MTRYQPFNDLPAAQFQALKDDIERRGLLMPIWVDEDDTTIDGHQRRRACAELGIDAERVVVEGLTEDEKRGLAVALNAFRRHLTGPERTEAIRQLSLIGWSARRIGGHLGISHQTVLRERSGGPDGPPGEVTGKDGKTYSGTRPQQDAPPEGVDPETGEIVDGATSGDENSSVAPSTDSEAGEDAPPNPPPSPASAPRDPTLSYRARATSERSKVRSGLLLLDPERVVTTSDDPDAWRQFSDDVRAFLDDLDGQLGRPHLSAVQ